MKSEFGMGLTYCLGLFLAHADRIHRDLEVYNKINAGENRAYSMWFYASYDHLYDFQAEQAPTLALVKKCEKFKRRCLSLRLPINEEKEATKEDYCWAMKEAKFLLMLIDKAHGVTVKQGQRE